MPLSSKKERRLAYFQRILTCYHEAGHAFVCLFSVSLPKRVSVRRCRNHWGLTSASWFKSPLKPVQKELSLARLYMLAAGAVSEELFYERSSGGALPSILKYGRVRDFREMREIICKDLRIPAHARARMWKKILIKTRKLLKEHWHTITNIAQELYKKKIIVLNDLKRVVIRSEPETAQRWREFFKMLVKAFRTKNLSMALSAQFKLRNK